MKCPIAVALYKAELCKWQRFDGITRVEKRCIAKEKKGNE